MYPQDISEDALLTLAAAVERGSTHPLAKAIVREAQSRGLNILWQPPSERWSGQGLKLWSKAKVLIAAADSRSTPQVEALEQAGQTVVAVMQDGVPMGMLALRDTLRDDAKDAVDALHRLGIQGVI